MKASVVIICGVFAMSHGLLALLWFGIGVAVPREIIGLLCLVFFAIWQAYIHEAAHFFVARSFGAQDVRLKIDWRKGFRVSYVLANSSLKPALISMAGPVSGLVFATAGLEFVHWWGHGHQAWATWLTMISLVGGMQVVFLLPFAIDGNIFVGSVWSLITRKKEIHEN